MKQLSTRSAHANNNRIVTIEDVHEIAFTGLTRAESALGLTGTVIHIGECANADEAKVFLDALITSLVGCLVTLPSVPDDGTLQRIHRLMVDCSPP
ncbi:hypothetical protein AIS09_21330 [Salmonella enterica]|nr:hypothetical protein [Salmonella enterica]EAX2706603.1 hypothetical protein [Salmonella enterica]